ncbi:MAG: ABC transporter permease, partial [Planctomycetota bacterium]|nr:ABC transporter permease [Planctomycetota bacterium]
MGRFAWRNLMTRPLRTVLALIGLSIPILGVIGLYSVSGSLRDLVGATLNKIQGLMVLREGQPSPVFSDLPANLA